MRSLSLVFLIPCVPLSARHSEILYSRRSISLIGSRLIHRVHNESRRGITPRGVILAPAIYIN